MDILNKKSINASVEYSILLCSIGGHSTSSNAENLKLDSWSIVQEAGIAEESVDKRDLKIKLYKPQFWLVRMKSTYILDICYVTGR